MCYKYLSYTHIHVEEEEEEEDYTEFSLPFVEFLIGCPFSFFPEDIMIDKRTLFCYESSSLLVCLEMLI